MKIKQRETCAEVWSQILSKKNDNSSYTPGRCKRDKSVPEKFSKENGRIPSAFSVQLLICGAFTLILISTSSCGYLNFKGHIMTLHQNVQKFAEILSNCPEDIAMISFSLKGKTKHTKASQVPRDNVCNALKSLAKHNP